MALALLPALPPEPVTPVAAPMQVVLLRDKALEPYWSHRYQPAKRPPPERNYKRFCRCRTRCQCAQPEPRRTETHVVYTTEHFCRCADVCSCLVVPLPINTLTLDDEDEGGDKTSKPKSVGPKNLSKEEREEADSLGRERAIVPRPVERADCVAPRQPCPWCKQKVVMKAARIYAEQLSAGDGRRAGPQQAYVACPNCERRVSYRLGLGGEGGHWERYDQRTATPGLDPRGSGVDPAVVNHCRPCVRVACKFNPFLEVKGRSIKLNFPYRDPHQMKVSCVLDITDRFPDGITLERVGKKLNLTMERVRQVEEQGLEKVLDAGELYGCLPKDGDDPVVSEPDADELDDEEIRWLREIVWEGCSCERHGPDVEPCSVVKALRALGATMEEV